MLPSSQQLFDLEHTMHESLFSEIKFPWEVLNKINSYITQYLTQDQNDRFFQTEIHPSAVIGSDVIISDGTTVAAHAVIEGPTIIGKCCDIRPGAYIRGNVIIGNDCVIGNSTEIKNSLLFDNVIVPHFNYVGDSILGYKVHLGGGAVISNYKSDGSEIIIKDGDVVCKTGLKKFGALIGDYVEIGSNALLNPGTIVGKRSIIYPAAVIRGVIPENVIVKVRQQQEIVNKI